MSPGRPVSHRGSSLVETIVAIVLLAIGVLGAVATATAATRLLRAAEARTRATRLAGEVLDSLLLVEAPGDGERVVPPDRASWSVGTEGPVTAIDLVVEYSDGVARRRLSFTMLDARPPHRLEDPR